MALLHRILIIVLVLATTAISAKAAPLKFKVTLIGTHDIDWTYHLMTDTLPGGGARTDLVQEGTEFINYDSKKSVIMIFKNKAGVGLVGSVKGAGIEKYPEVIADITNGNVVDYTCSGNCPPPPDLNFYRSGCGSHIDSARVKLTYDSGTFTIKPMRVSDLGGLPGGLVVPGGIDPSAFVLPIGTLIPQNCGPIFPPTPGDDFVDYRYPYLLDSNSNLLPGKLSTAVDNKLTKLKVGKSLTVDFDFSVSPIKTFLFEGNGYTYSGGTSVTWRIKLKRLS